MITEAILSVFLSPLSWLFGALVGVLPLLTLPVDFAVGLGTLFGYVKCFHRVLLWIRNIKNNRDIKQRITNITKNVHILAFFYVHYLKMYCIISTQNQAERSLAW